MAFVRIWSEINFLGTSTDLSVGAVDSTVDSTYTIKSVEVAPFYCITVFDGATYTGTSKTYFTNNVDTSAFSAIKSIIVQNCHVPYHNDYEQTVVSANENEPVGKISFNASANFLTETQVIDIFRNKSVYNFDTALKNIQSIKIPPGFFIVLQDDNKQLMTFYNSVYFLDAFKEYNISSSTSFVSMKVLMKNPPCFVTDPCSTCPTCQPNPTCYFPCSDIFDSMNTVYIILGVFFAAMFLFVMFFSFKKNNNINTDNGISYVSF